MVALAIRTGIPFQTWTASPNEVVATALELLEKED